MAITVASVVPTSDRIAGGVAAIVLGTGFVATPGVKFGTTAATSVVFVSSKKLTCVVPAHAAGAVTVTVTNPDTSTGSKASAFTFYTPDTRATALVADIGGQVLRIKRSSVSLSQQSSGGRATFNAYGAEPTPFLPMRLGLGSLADADLLFRGKGQIAALSYASKKENTVWAATAADSLPEFNRKLVFGAYVAQNADVVALDIISQYAPDFSGAHIVSGLTAVAVTFTGETPDQAFQQLATMIGGYYYRDDSYDVHLFVTESPALTPDALTAASQTLQNDPPIVWTADTAQVRNRIHGFGASVRVAVAAAIGDTALALQATDIFDSSGTVFVPRGAQFLTYTGKTAGGVTVSTGDALSTGTVSAAEASPLVAGRVTGTVSYKTAYGTANGQSRAGSASSNVTITTLGDPSSGWDTSLAPTGGTGGLSVGSYAYIAMMVTATGQKRSLGFNSTFNIVSGAVSYKPIVIGGGFTDTRVTRIDLYRSKVNNTSGPYYFVASFAPQAASQAYTDTLPDTNLGAQSLTSTQMAVDTASNGQVNLTSISTSGDARVTSRIIYRTKAGGSIYYKLATIGNNTDTTFTDNVDDASLSEVAPSTDTVAFPIGKTSLGVADLAQVNASGGWLLVNGQPIRYTGRSGSSGAGTVTGVPSGGVGSITAIINTGSGVTACGTLTGIPSSSVGSITTALVAGDEVQLYALRNNVPSQTAIAAIEGGTSTGIYEFRITDSSFVTQTSLNARCDADLVLNAASTGVITIAYTTLDSKSRVGRPVHVDLSWVDRFGVTQHLTGDFTIQSVSVSLIDEDGNDTPPKYACTASSVRVSRTLEDILRHVLVAA